MKSFVKFTVLILCYIFVLVGCGKNIDEEKSSQNTEKIEKNITSDFQHETNTVGQFQEWEFEMPQDWSYEIGETNNSIHFYPDKETPPVFSFGLMNSEEEYDLSDKVWQDALANAIVELYKEQIGDCTLLSYDVPIDYIELSDGELLDITGVYELFIKCSGTIDDKAYNGDIIAYYRGGQLYVFNLFQYIDSEYDFFNDMCSINASFKKSSKNNENNDNSSVDNSEESNINKADVSKIEVSFTKDRIDGDDLHLKVYIKNISEMKFSGDIHVFFYTKEGNERLGSDLIIVDELLPGQHSWTNVVIDKYMGTPELELEFTNPIFTSIEEHSAEINNDVTEKTKNSFRLNFEGVSWYEDVMDIVVYKDGTCVVTIKLNAKEDGQFYANAIWSCSNVHGVERVRVVDDNGNLKTVYP
ncbi:MAG: hypothetical protein IJA07_11300 [Agathobacter sp.]|nr:hypothetical protein [Agathobacter sp.]